MWTPSTGSPPPPSGGCGLAGVAVRRRAPWQQIATPVATLVEDTFLPLPICFFFLVQYVSAVADGKIPQADLCHCQPSSSDQAQGGRARMASVPFVLVTEILYRLIPSPSLLLPSLYFFSLSISLSLSPSFSLPHSLSLSLPWSRPLPAVWSTSPFPLTVPLPLRHCLLPSTWLLPLPPTFTIITTSRSPSAPSTYWQGWPQ